MNIHQPISEPTVGRLVAERPERGRFFEGLGIDYCCGGRIPLREACAKLGLDAARVRDMLADFDREPAGPAEPDWNAASLSALADHIEQTHHRRMRDDLPRVAALVAKVAGVHTDRHPELAELKAEFDAFAGEMFEHIRKEDDVLFPLIRSIEGGGAPDRGRAALLDPPVLALMSEHDAAGRSVRRMRELTGGFTPPDDACGTYRVMLSGLREIERDLHVHVHKENNILFARARGADDRAR